MQGHQWLGFRLESLGLVSNSYSINLLCVSGLSSCGRQLHEWALVVYARLPPSLVITVIFPTPILALLTAEKKTGLVLKLLYHTLHEIVTFF